MKNTLFILVLMLMASMSFAKEILPTYTLDNSQKDEQLGKNESSFKFTFKSIYDENLSRIIHYSIDGKDSKISMIDNSYIIVNTSPGKHLFQFYYSDRYYEITTDSLLIKPQYCDHYSIYFVDALYPVEVEKPVIYLYPESIIDVEVKVNTKGKTLFMYPEYDEGWKLTAHPNGDLEFEGKTYNYLFWESEQLISPTTKKEGFIIAGENAIQFLEEKLSLAGFNSKEQADFITFWAPKMIQHPWCLVHFVMNEECDQFAELTIEPEPDLVARLYMIWSPIDNIDDFNYLRPQNIQLINRLGFTVLEWGGAKVKHLSMKNEAL